MHVYPMLPQIRGMPPTDRIFILSSIHMSSACLLQLLADGAALGIVLVVIWWMTVTALALVHTVGVLLRINQLPQIQLYFACMATVYV